MKIHPRKNDKGQAVAINKPHAHTGLETWTDPTAQAVVVPEGPMPERIGDVRVSQWAVESSGAGSWVKLAATAEFDEPPFNPPSGLRPAAGVVTIEPDGRVWVVAPSNAFGGYEATFPKGRVDPGTDLRPTALREAYEESGLLVELHAFLIDVPRSLTYTRYYIAKRLAGDPSQMGWESQAVMLVPQTKLGKVLNNSNDTPILEAITRYLTAR